MSNAEIERRIFWDMLNKALDENGNPFSFTSRIHYAAVNRKSPSADVCLSLEFLVQKKFLRVGIFILDDVKTPYFDELQLHMNEIEKKLGFSPIWNDKGAKNPNTRRIEVRLPFIPYDHDDYKGLIDFALPIMMKYIDVFSSYIPELFE